jgi:hypothetical protein
MTKRKTQENNGMRFVGFKVEPDVIDRFRKVAAAEERTVSQELRHLVNRRLAEAERKEAA